MAYSASQINKPTTDPASSTKPDLTQAGAGGFAVDAGITPSESQAQALTDVTTRAGSVAAGTLRYDFFSWLGGQSRQRATGPTPMLGNERRRFTPGLSQDIPSGGPPRVFTSVTAMDTLKNMSADDRAKIQRQLYDAGWYKAASSRYYAAKNPKQPNYGGKTLDNDTAIAFNEAIAFAINTRQSLDDVLGLTDGLRELDDAKKEAAAQATPLVVQLTPEETMRSVARKLWMSEAGRDPTPAELNRLIASYHGIETAAQQQAYAAGGYGLPGGPGGTVVAPPSPQDYAESQVGQTAAVEVGAQRLEQGLAALRQLFTGGGGGG